MRVRDRSGFYSIIKFYNCPLDNYKNVPETELTALHAQ